MIKRILVVSLSNIGDVILTLPVVNTLKANFPQAALSLVIGPKATALFSSQEMVTSPQETFFKKIIVYDKKGSFPSQVKFLLQLWKQGHFDLVIDLRNTLIPFLVAATRFNSPLQRPRGLMPMRQKHLKALDFLRIDLNKSMKCPLFAPRDEAALHKKMTEAGWQGDKNLVLVSPGARHWFKTWPPASFVALCTRLSSEDHRIQFAVCGSGEERQAADIVSEGLGKKSINLAGQLTLAEFACLVSQARMLISNDSAAMHLAHYLETPVVAIFGPTHPEKYGLVSERARVVFNKNLGCRPCEKATCPTKRECLTELSVEDVFKEAQELLRRFS